VIRVTAHAIRRARERAPAAFDQPTPGAVANAIAAEVGAALADGRFAKTKPRWAAGGPGPRHKTRAPSERFAWDVDTSRCWVIKINAETTIVKTLLAPPTQHWLDRAEARTAP